MPSIGENIKRVRNEKGYTQAQLGARCAPKMADSAIRRYENNRVTPKLLTVRKIARALDVPLSELIDDWGIFSTEELKKDFWLPVLQEADQVIEESKILEMVRKAFDNDAAHILTIYTLLNETGKSEAIKRISELTEIKKYTE